MLLIHTDPAKPLPTTMSQDYRAFTQAIIDSGEFGSGEPLHGPDAATTVRVREGSTTTTDGRFAEVKEPMAGSYVVDVADLDRAIELAARIPDAKSAGVEV